MPLRTEKWTVDELLELPEDQGYRIERVDGTVLVSPAPPVIHQRLLMRAMFAFRDATPAEYLAVHVVDVVFSADRLLIPDFVVSKRPELDGSDYREVARGVDGVLMVERPFPLTLDLGGPG